MIYYLAFVNVYVFVFFLVDEMESFVNDNIESDTIGESDDECVELDQAPLKKRKKETTGRKRSEYHSHFKKTAIKDKLQCKYCPTIITYTSLNGTTGLKSHISRCPLYPPNLDRKQKLIDFETKTIMSDDGTTEIVNVPKLWEYNPSVSRKQCAKMIIVDELPFAHVEGEGFRDFCKSLCPIFIPPSRSTVTRDCYSLFIDERVKLKDFFSKMSSRVSLTTDTWSSNQNLCYMCLTAHFIDDDWKLHKRIINFCLIGGHSGELLGRSIEQCLVE